MDKSQSVSVSSVGRGVAGFYWSAMFEYLGASAPRMKTRVVCRVVGGPLLYQKNSHGVLCQIPRQLCCEDRRENLFYSKRLLGSNSKSGFTLIEVLVVIGIIAILAAIVVVAINPARQFAQARNSQRTSNINSIINAIGQRMADNKGLFRDSADTVCTLAMDIQDSTSTIAQSGLDLRPCLVPVYLAELPVDPVSGSTWNGSTYSTGYTVGKDSSTGRITVAAPSANAPSELNQIISLTR